MMKTYQLSIKQRAQQRGHKRYKMEGHKSWQAKKYSKEGKSQKERKEIKYLNPPPQL